MLYFDLPWYISSLFLQAHSATMFKASLAVRSRFSLFGAILETVMSSAYAMTSVASAYALFYGYCSLSNESINIFHRNGPST